MAKQTEAYNTLKTTRDAKKAELDAIYARDDAGEDVDYEALDALEEAFGEIDGTYQEAKEHLEERQRTANNKAFNKANADATKSATRLADAIKREAEFKATKTAAEADVTKLLARIEQLKKELTQSGNSQTVQNQIIEANSALTPAFAKFEAAKTEYNLALVEKNEATTQNTTLKAALETAKKAKDSSDRKEADAARLRIRTAYEEATAARDAATAALDEFRAQWEEFDETTELDADQQALYDELDHAVYEAGNAYELAAFAMQKENAAEVAKAKEAERAAVLEARAMKELERGEAEELLADEETDLHTRKEEAEYDIENLKSSVQFTTDEDELDALMEQLAERKLDARDFQAQIEAKQQEMSDLKEKHFQERQADIIADEAAAEKDRKDAEFNEQTAAVLDAYNALGKDKTKFEGKMAEKQAELEEAQGLPEEEQDQRRINLLTDYIDAYQQQIDALQGQVDEATEQFEMVSEEKRLRKE